MKALKGLVALLLFGVSALVAVRIVIPPLRCNLDKARVNAATVLPDRPRTYGQIRRARRLETMCLRCLEILPNDPEFRTLLGSNQRMLGQYDEAERNYRRSLDLAERAETYAFLALLQLDRGRLEEARQNLYHACLFNMSFVEMVSSPMREEIYEAVIQRHTKLRGGSRPDLLP
jgi:tetratricopeptide (TPR) repeat protein